MGVTTSSGGSTGPVAPKGVLLVAVVLFALAVALCARHNRTIPVIPVGPQPTASASASR